ncbi:MAG TPA: glycosyltransferase [Gaiella sp.]
MASPLVSVILAARDAEATIDEAVASVLRQTVEQLELVVVDDGSVDLTHDRLAAIPDRRLRVLRNETSLGLGGALNVGLDAALGAFVARMDADDVALPAWLARILTPIRSQPRLGVVGTGMIELHADGSLGAVHRMPVGRRAVRWAALFSTPFYHSTVILDRATLEEHGLRYDVAFDESEDFELWTRLLAVSEGDNISDAMVLYRQHPGQASRRRRELQLELGRRIGLREIGRVAPALPPERAELAWLAGCGWGVPAGRAREATEALSELVEEFERRHGGTEARRAAAWALARSPAADASDRATLARGALRLDPALPARAIAKLRRRRMAGAERAAAASWLDAARDAPVRLTLVVPEPTPFRTVMLDRVATRSELDLTVLYAGSTVQRRTWTIEPRHRAVFLEGRRVPGAYGVLRHEYPLSLGIFGALAASDPEVVVVSGWSTFASQAAAAWCRRSRVPYVLLVESNERDARPGWRRAVKEAVVPPIVAGAAEVLVVGSLAREAMRARGVDDARISLFADTIDTAGFAAEADRLVARRDALRAEAGLSPDDVVVLSVARLAPEKGVDTLVRAAALVGDPRVVVVLAGTGAEQQRLEALAASLGVRLVLLPDIPWERIGERFAIADVFALLSRHEPWGVVVNEAAASGLPLVLSDRVGAAFDLLEDGRNGALVPADDPVAAADAIRALVSDPEYRAAAGQASRELMRSWGYEPSIENLIHVARRVAGRQPASASS